MTVRVNKSSFNIREKLTELGGKQDKLLFRPTFSCSGSGNYTTTTGDQNISSFCGSVVNFDNNGDLDDGKFTAPISGLYHFDLKLRIGYSSGYMFSYVFKNGSSMSNHNCQFYQNNNVCTLSFPIYANAGDYFEPYIASNYSGGTVSSPLWCGHYIG